MRDCAIQMVYLTIVRACRHMSLRVLKCASFLVRLKSWLLKIAASWTSEYGNREGRVIALYTHLRAEMRLIELFEPY